MPATGVAARFLTPRAAVDRLARMLPAVAREAMLRRVARRLVGWRRAERRSQRPVVPADCRPRAEPRSRPRGELVPRRRRVEPAGSPRVGRRETSLLMRGPQVARVGTARVMFHCPPTPIGRLTKGRAAPGRAEPAGRQRAPGELWWWTQGPWLTQPCPRMPGFRRTSDPGALLAAGQPAPAVRQRVELWRTLRLRR